MDAEQQRLGASGLASIDERGTECCYAKQDKFWVEGSPGGERWEVYTVLADSPVLGCETSDGAACNSAAHDESEAVVAAVGCC